jgi:tRNA-splicing ligase RtcB (3'-phosphate/5'-hydroxy nucleic acid ligase)
MVVADRRQLLAHRGSRTLAGACPFSRQRHRILIPTFGGSIPPANLIWSEGQNHLHRKGACPAASHPKDPLFPDGHPVIVPGSMGDASYVLKGQGSIASLCSAPHGAGRLAARGEGRKSDAGELRHLRVVTKIDATRVRRAIAVEHLRTLMEKAPSQYKSVTAVVETVADAGIASPVARLRPLLTVKG